MNLPNRVVEAIEHGYSVIPTGIDKKPLFSWKEHQDRHATVEEADAWQVSLAPPSWAVVCGKISQVVVLDFDGDVGREHVHRCGLKPHTQTGSGGYHIYVEHPGWPVPTLNGKSKSALGELYPGLDIRADGGYAIFCGRNLNGEYVSLRDLTPDPISVLPPDLRLACGLEHPPATPVESTRTSSTNPNTIACISCKPVVDGDVLILKAQDRLRAGEGRNDTGFWLSCQLRDNNFHLADAEAVMRRYAGSVGSTNTKGILEPYTEADAIASVRQAYSRPAREPWTRRTSASGKSKIRVEFEFWTEALDEMTLKTWEVLEQANQPPVIYRSGSELVWIESEDDGSPSIRPLNDDRMRFRLMEIAEWYYHAKTKSGDEWIRKALPVQLINNLLVSPKNPLPILVGIVEAPVFSAEGKLQITPGYNPHTRTYFDDSSGIIIPPVSEIPSEQEVIEARRLLIVEVLGDFPFVSDSECAHALAMIILPFVREIIAGPTPFHLLEKPTPGTGATLLAELPGLIFTGRATTAMTEGRDEDEWRKRLFAKLRKGPSIIFIDNIRRRLDSASFSSALTAWPFWEDRVLGVSEILRVLVRAMWIGSGNNPAVSNEVSRRTVRIRLDAKVDRPWLREGFRHPDLRSWVKQNRAQLIWACLTLVSHWVAAGRPRGKQVLGMFEEWAQTLGGILETAGIHGFLGNLSEFYEQSDEEGAAWRGFLEAWWESKHDRAARVKELLPIASAVDGLELGDGNEPSQRARLGKLLARMKDRIFQIGTVDGQPIRLRIATAGTSGGANAWRLIEQVGVVGVSWGFPASGEIAAGASGAPDSTTPPKKLADDPHRPPSEMIEASKWQVEGHPVSSGEAEVLSPFFQCVEKPHQPQQPQLPRPAEEWMPPAAKQSTFLPEINPPKGVQGSEPEWLEGEL